MSYQSIPVSLVEAILALSIFFAIFIFLVFACSRRLLPPLLVGLFLRCVALLYQRFVAPLPQGAADAVTMERRAWLWAQSGCGNLGEHLNLGASYVHSWIIGNVYACTDRAPLAFQMINVAMGMLTVYFIARIARELWDKEAMIRAAWVASLFPFFIIFSAITLREVWFTAFFLLSILCIVRWVKFWNILNLIAAVAALLIAAIFHGSAIFALVGMLLIIAFWGLRELLHATQTAYVKAGKVVGAFLLMVSAVVGFTLFGDMRFSSIGEVGQVMERAETLDESAAAARGGSAYPGYLVPSNDLQAIILTPVRMFYVLFGPPPWEIRSPIHIIGMFDGLLYFAMAFLLQRYWREWWARPEYRLLLVIFIVVSVILAWGVNNFGTATRHRAKFAGILIAMSAGLLGRQRWRDERLKSLREIKPFKRPRHSVGKKNVSCG